MIIVVVAMYPVCVCECPGVGDDVLVGEHQVHQHHLAVEDTPHLPHLLLLLHLLARGVIIIGLAELVSGLPHTSHLAPVFWTLK